MTPMDIEIPAYGQGLQEKFCKAKQNCLGPRGQGATFLKLRSNKATGKIS
jgi:hypothetical protein